MLELTDRDRDLLDGVHGPGRRLAMEIVVHTARTMGAERLLDISRAHIDSCVFYGVAGLDFAERLVSGGASVVVPTTLNISSLDLLHPELYRGDDETRELATRLTDAYIAMGGYPTWTCAPYHLPDRPVFGEQIAWAESNAIVFANSVIGARTDRYGDFIDVSCAVTGRAPAAGLHLSENRSADVLFRINGIPDHLLGHDVLFPVLGHLLGRRAGTGVPVIEGLLPTTTEDQLKAIGAAAASSGSVAMFHAVGVTPEAPTLTAALGGQEPQLVIDVTPPLLAAARDELTTRTDLPLRAVNLGTPHMSIDGFAALVFLIDGRRIHNEIDCYVNTGRDTLNEVAARGWLETLEASNVQIVTDTCTYVTPIVRRTDGLMMTDSGKWAWYAPGNLGVDVVYAATEECVESAIAGRIVRDPAIWQGV